MIRLNSWTKPILFVFLILGSVLLLAGGLKKYLGDSDLAYFYHKEVQDFIFQLSEDEKIPLEKLNNIFTQVKRNQRVIDLISNPAESVLTWDEYKNRMITPPRVREGVAFLKKNRRVLDEIEKAFGVDKEVLVAILGIETSYGKNQGGFLVIEALATLAFDYPSRAAFFRRELASFLKMAHLYQLDVFALKGSYAGAMGMPQFMPSSYLQLAIPYYSEAHASDIWNNESDVIITVANYLRKNGWKERKPYLIDGQYYGKKEPEELHFLRPEKTYQQLKKEGWSSKIDVLYSDHFLPIALEEAEKMRYWLGPYNFYVISRYNPRLFYALSVSLLAQAIEKSNT